jgi:hypothetical protein
MPEERRLFLKRALAVLKELPPERIEELKKLTPEKRRQELRTILQKKGIEIPEPASRRQREETRPGTGRGAGEGPRGSQGPQEPKAPQPGPQRRERGGTARQGSPAPADRQ